MEAGPAEDELSSGGVRTGGLFRSRSLPHYLGGGRVSGAGDSGLGLSCKGRPASEVRQLITLRQHYYPEGGWGWLVLSAALSVQLLAHGTQLSTGLLASSIQLRFLLPTHAPITAWVGAMSTAVSLMVSPITIAVCRKKSTRLTAVIGGLVTALGLLFSSFATQFHQLFISYGAILGVGVSMTRDCSTLMVAQYFKRRRELVEIFIVSGSGLGLAIMSAFLKSVVSAIGWRFGLQSVTVAVFLTFFLGTFYRSASLYHPQRRAILHLKNQKRKIKDKNKTDDGPPFIDFAALRSKTVRILLLSSALTAFGINTPIFYLAHHLEEEGLDDSVLVLQAYMGIGWVLGCLGFGTLVLNNSAECRIARQYLSQVGSMVCCLSILALTSLSHSKQGYVFFTWIYGIFCGGYHYILKVFIYERVRARNFARTWGFVQFSQSIPIALGVPITGYINVEYGGKSGYYFSASCVFLGTLALFLIDCHRRWNRKHHKHSVSDSKVCDSDICHQGRRPSFGQEPEELVVVEQTGGGAPGAGGKPELTCISEEGIADMDLPDNILDDLDLIGDCITSCNKVENYLMLSEFENNLIAEMPVIMDRKGRRWSLARHAAEEENPRQVAKWRLIPNNPNNRVITVIDEASV